MTATLTPPSAPPRPSLADQLDRNRRTRRRIVRAVLAVLLVAGIGAAVWVVYFSRVLEARAVVVTGTHQLKAEQVDDVAAVPLGRPLVREDLDAIARRATALPQVSAAHVTRDWPHTVRIAVTERQPLLGVAQPGGFLIADKEGVVFGAEPSLPFGVVAVAVDPANRPLLVELGSVALSLPDDVRKQVKSISATSPDSIRLTTTSGLTIVWGDSTQSALKAQVAVALLDQGAKTTIDVSSPHTPAVR